MNEWINERTNERTHARTHAHTNERNWSLSDCNIMVVHVNKCNTCPSRNFHPAFSLDHIRAATWQNQPNECAPGEDSDQPGHPLSAWRKLGSLATQWAHREDSNQTGRMPRLIWVFAGRTVILLVLSCRGSYSSVLRRAFQKLWRKRGPQYTMSLKRSILSHHFWTSIKESRCFVSVISLKFMFVFETIQYSPKMAPE